MIAMAAAILATIVLLAVENAMSTTGWMVAAAGFAVGGGIGLYVARTVRMTGIPQLVSLFNAVGGGAAALLAIHDLTSGRGVDTTAALDRRAGHHHRRGDVHRVADRGRQAPGPGLGQPDRASPASER